MTGDGPIALATVLALAPGLTIEARFRRGHCAAGRIVSHRGLRLTPLRGGELLAAAPETESIRFAFYPAEILGNGRQPYDQHDASYLPLAYDALHLTAVGDWGALVVQKAIDRGPINTTVTDDGFVSLFRAVPTEAKLRDEILALARLAGVPHGSLLRVLGGEPGAFLTPAT